MHDFKRFKALNSYNDGGIFAAVRDQKRMLRLHSN